MPILPSSASSVRILLELGRGGMGIVFLAVLEGDAGAGQLRVVKRLRPELEIDPQAVAMFLDEARLAARLQHPNVVETYEGGFDGAHPFLEMEYLEGQSYDAVRRRLGSTDAGVPLELAAWIIARILDGLEYAHELRSDEGQPLNLVHRDVSPHNVMLTYDGGVKLLDFGIAKAVDSSLETRTGVVKGKVTYMAPEQASRGVVDRRADVFAAGVMLWEAMAGTRYWGDKNEFEIFLGLRELALPEAPSGPPALEAICRRALAPAPADRYPTAAAMRADIDAFLADHRPPTGPEALAVLLIEHFDAQRKAVQAEIAFRLRSGLSLVRTSDVPVLQHPALVDAAPDRTKLRQRSEIRGLRFVSAAALVLALVASSAVGIVAWRSRARGAAGPMPSASNAAPSGCMSNGVCSAQLGLPAVCRRRDRVCVAIETDACKVVAGPGDLQSDRALLVGAMFPLSGPQAQPIGEPSLRAVDLARRDFVEVARGLPSSTGQAAPRPVVVIRCDDAVNSAEVARHLVTDLEVPAVIGFGSSNDFIDLATSLFIPNHVLAVASKNSSALITAIPGPSGEPRLVFRTSLSSAAVAVPVSALVSEVLEPARRALVGAPRPLRVALLRRDSASGLAVGDALFAALHFNGKTALANGEDFREVPIAEPGDPKALGSYASAVRELLTFVPDIVLYAGADELTSPLFAPIESRWPRGVVRPLYIALNSLAGAGATLFSWIGRNADRRHRFLGIAAPASTPTNARFTMRYNQAYDDKVTPNLSPAAPYDAFYVIAYAAIAAGDGASSGGDLARAIGRLVPPGKRIEVGPTSIFDAVATLRAGQPIDLHGAGGPLDFDVATGESSADYVFVCPGVDAQGGATVEVESGLSFASAEHSLRGALHCP